MAIVAEKPGGNGFFSNVGQTFLDTFKEALPVWTAQQLKLQSKDQLSKPVFNAGAAAPRQANEGLQTTGATLPVQKTLWDTYTAPIYNVSGVAIVATVVGLLAVYLLIGGKK